MKKTSTIDSFRGCLLGGAVGDALGAPVEFLNRNEIERGFGECGIRDFASAYGTLGGITDDTQMTLFTAEGLLLADDSVVVSVHRSYLRWLQTQGRQPRFANVETDFGLFQLKELHADRAPGLTCLSALIESRLEDPWRAKNNSKGCGGVMRAAPVGLYVAAKGLPAEKAFEWGTAIAAITHGHPTGQYPAGVLAFLICEIVRGSPLPAAAERVIDVLNRQGRQGGETLEALEYAIELAGSSMAPLDAISELGEGWVAEEALAIAIYAVLKASNLEEAIILAVNHSGDSDSTGAIAGNLAGALYGTTAIPERWLVKLELREVIVSLADQLRWGKKPRKPQQIS